jgi:predicted CoA-binding protein
VDGVVICVNPKYSAQALRDAAAVGIQNIWLQQGAQSVETGKVARELGLDPVSGKCILMYAGEVKSIHGFHKFFAKILGQY